MNTHTLFLLLYHRNSYYVSLTCLSFECCIFHVYMYSNARASVVVYVFPCFFFFVHPDSLSFQQFIMFSIHLPFIFRFYLAVTYHKYILDTEFRLRS